MRKIKINDLQKVLYKAMQYNYYMILKNVHIDYPLKNTMYVCKGVDMSYEYYDSKAKEYVKLNSIDPKCFNTNGIPFFVASPENTIVLDNFALYKEIDAHKTMNFIKEKPTMLNEGIVR